MDAFYLITILALAWIIFEQGRQINLLWHTVEAIETTHANSLRINRLAIRRVEQRQAVRFRIYNASAN